MPLLFEFLNVLQADQLIEALNSKEDTNWSIGASDPFLKSLNYDEVPTNPADAFLGDTDVTSLFV